MKKEIKKPKTIILECFKYKKYSVWIEHDKKWKYVKILNISKTKSLLTWNDLKYIL